MTNNPKKTDAFVYYGYDLKVVDQVPIVAPEPGRAAAIPGRQARQDGPSFAISMPRNGAAWRTGDANARHDAADCNPPGQVGTVQG